MYPIRYTDSEGKPLTGSKKYVIRFKSAPLVGRSGRTARGIDRLKGTRLLDVHSGVSLWKKELALQSEGPSGAVLGGDCIAEELH